MAFLCNPGPDLVSVAGSSIGFPSWFPHVGGGFPQIVLDEGHRIKDNKTKLAMALANVATRRRVVMTGCELWSPCSAVAVCLDVCVTAVTSRYPLQNHLVEYYCMVEFASPGILGDKKTFINNVVKPVNTAKENPKFKYEAMRKLKALTTHLKPIALRRDVSYLKCVVLVSNVVVKDSISLDFCLGTQTRVATEA
jgi:hypothetical protein